MGTIYEDTALQKRRYRRTRINKNFVLIESNRYIHMVFIRWRRLTYDRLVSKTSRRSEAKRITRSSEERGSISRIHPWVLRVWMKLQTRAWIGMIPFLWRSSTYCPWFLLLYLVNFSERLWSSYFQIIIHIKRVKHMRSFLPNTTRSYFYN